MVQDFDSDDKYSLVGVDGNAFSVMAYVARAMRECGLKDEVAAYQEQAMSSDYTSLLFTSMLMVDRLNALVASHD